MMLELTYNAGAGSATYKHKAETPFENAGVSVGDSIIRRCVWVLPFYVPTTPPLAII